MIVKPTGLQHSKIVPSSGRNIVLVFMLLHLDLMIHIPFSLFVDGKK